MEDDNKRGRADEVHSHSIRAGKRTYFFDVKTTRAKDLYLTITESKKKFNDNGKSYYEKHKIFLYKEDFEKFTEGLESTLDKIRELQQLPDYQSQESNNLETSETQQYSDIEFEDLG